MQGIVYKSTGSWYSVKGEQGVWYQARIKGVFKIGGITSTNPIAVGDKVDIVVEDDAAGTAMIVKIHDRHNYINRQSPRAKRQHHIVAANLDQTMLVATLKDPRTSQGFIDRFLVAAEMYHVPAVIVINKADTYGEEELEQFLEWKQMYEKVGYTVLLVSGVGGDGMNVLRSLLKDKVSLFSGHSGVGKSTLLNQLLPDADIKTQQVSDWSGKGMHTTTFAEMHDLPDGGSVIDTPGIREFGLVNLAKAELSHYFPEMRAVLNDCRYNNCLHFNERECAVKDAVNAGGIHEDRYVSYLTIMDSIEERKY